MTIGFLYAFGMATLGVGGAVAAVWYIWCWFILLCVGPHTFFMQMGFGIPLFAIANVLLLISGLAWLLMLFVNP